MMVSEATGQEPSVEEWRRLYSVMARVKELEPWREMMEEDIFGVQDPETGEFGYLSVMGNLGEYLAVAVYLGKLGYYGFRALEQAGDFASETPELVFETPQLQASWADREDLEKEDRDVIKELGLKFRGRGAWPLFRSYRPGQIPWFLDSWETRFLTIALEQLLEIYPRFHEQPDLLAKSRSSDDILVRIPHSQDGNLAWDEEVQRVAPVEPRSINLTMDMDAFETLKNTPEGDIIVEVDFLMFMSPVHDEAPGERPYFPYMLLSEDAKSGMIIGLDMLKPLPSLEEMWGMIPAYMAGQLASLGRPKEIHLRSLLLETLLQPLADTLSFRIKQTQRLGMLDQARDAILDQFTNGPKPLYPE